MNTPSMQELLEAGVHFGHQVRRWNPKMKRYIYGAKDGVHVIDLAHTVEGLERACEFVRRLGEGGGTIIFVGTKRQAQDVIKNEAQEAGAKYITTRWIGGLLTNFDVVAKNIKKLNDWREQKETGGWSEFTKKEQVLMGRELVKLEDTYGGIADMIGLPGALYVVDTHKETSAVREAIKKGIPIVAICDTNVDPTATDYPIPGNDDAIKAIEIITHAIAQAYKEGREAGVKKAAKAEADTQAAEDRAAKAEDVKIEESEIVAMEKAAEKEEAKGFKEQLTGNK